MPWIARDQTGSNPYRVFGVKPTKLQMVNYGGGRIPDNYTWSVEHAVKKRTTYGPLYNNESTRINEKDCPIYLMPGEGPIKIKLVLGQEMQSRPFERENI